MNEKSSRLKLRAKTQSKVRPNGVAGAREVVRGATSRALGVRLVSLTRKKVVAEMRIKPLHINRNGRVNGGMIMAFADALGAAGTIANLPPGYVTATLESKTNFFAAGTGPALTAVSIPLHIGRTTMVWQTTIRDSGRRRVAIVTQTQIVIAAQSARPPRSPAAIWRTAASAKSCGARASNQRPSTGRMSRSSD